MSPALCTSRVARRPSSSSPGSSSSRRRSRPASTSVPGVVESRVVGRAHARARRGPVRGDRRGRRRLRPGDPEGALRARPVAVQGAASSSRSWTRSPGHREARSSGGRCEVTRPPCRPTVPDVTALRRDVRRLPLRGADLVLMARHPRWKGVGLSHNTSSWSSATARSPSERISARARSVPGRVPLAGGAAAASVPVGQAALGRRPARDAELARRCGGRPSPRGAARADAVGGAQRAIEPATRGAAPHPARSTSSRRGRRRRASWC